MMIDLTGKSVFVKTQEEYLKVLKMAKLQGFKWIGENHLNALNIPIPNMLKFYDDKNVTYYSDDKPLYEASEIVVCEEKINKGVIAESILHYGKNNQSTVCMEECAELIQAISKAKRGKINRDNLTEEIADVLICIEMLKQMYMISEDKINKWIEKKQAREAERMEKNE